MFYSLIFRFSSTLRLFETVKDLVEIYGAFYYREGRERLDGGGEGRGVRWIVSGIVRGKDLANLVGFGVFRMPTSSSITP